MHSLMWGLRGCSFRPSAPRSSRVRRRPEATGLLPACGAAGRPCPGGTVGTAVVVLRLKVQGLGLSLAPMWQPCGPECLTPSDIV